MALVTVAQKADLLYARSGLRKTTNIGLIAKWMWHKYKKRTRLITADPGGFDVLKPLVDIGLIEPWVLIKLPNFLTTLEKACEGYWPEDLGKPDGPLAPPEATDWSKIGFVAIEGLTSFGDQALLYLQDQKASLSQDPSYIWADGDRTFAGGNKAYFGLVQSRLYAMVIKSHMLPCEKVLWTALEGVGEEDRVPVYGPAIVGKQSTGKATQWFGNTVHIEGQLKLRGVNKDSGQEEFDVEPFMYVATHADTTTKMKYMCKHRAPLQFASEMPTVLPAPDMSKLYEILDNMNQRARAMEAEAGMDEQSLKMPSLLPVDQRPKPKIVGVQVSPVIASNVAVPKVVSVSPVPQPGGQPTELSLPEVKVSQAKK